MKKKNKIISRGQLVLIRLINNFNVKTYMQVYNNWLRKQGVRIPIYDGVGYIDPSAYLDGTDFKLISIGRNVTISKEVILLTHDYSIWNGLIAKDINNEKLRYYFMKQVSIGNNCFIGARTTILPGTQIGDNVIIGAGAVVKSKVPSNTVWGGNPAKQIMTIEEFNNKHIKLNDFVSK